MTVVPYWSQWDSGDDEDDDTSWRQTIDVYLPGDRKGDNGCPLSTHEDASSDQAWTHEGQYLPGMEHIRTHQD